jgi:cysteinyl-tRNA synthetase
LQDFDDLFAVLQDDDGPKIKDIVEWARNEDREQEINPALLATVNAQQLSDADIEKKVAEMEAARRSRNFKASDAVRAELGAAGIIVEITKDGVRWRRK